MYFKTLQIPGPQLMALEKRPSRKRSAGAHNQQQNGGDNSDDSGERSPVSKKPPGPSGSLEIREKPSTQCKICLESPKDPHTTSCCNALFCNSCLSTAMLTRPRCPSCSMETSVAIPFDLKEPKPEPLDPDLNSLFDAGRHTLDGEGLMVNNVPAEEMDVALLDSVIRQLGKIRREKSVRVMDHTKRLTEYMLDDMTKKMRNEIQSMNRHLNTMYTDLEFTRKTLEEQASSLSISRLNGTPSVQLPSIDNISHPVYSLFPPNDVQFERVKKHRDSISTFYLDHLSTVTPPSLDQNSEVRLGALGEIMSGVAKYAEVERVATLNYDAEPVPQMSIVSSLEFDKDCERFVVAGVTKKIKIFNFDSVKDNPSGVHYPLTQLKCKSKISNISWNPSEKEILCSSDYDGHVTVWDTSEGKIVRTFEEHEKRCWTVHFNNVDSNLIASGSDDSKVKLWNLSCDRSVGTIEAKVNVCCVYFSPSNRNELVFGSADHCVHLYDIRNPARALSILKGHRKAVSYVRYINDDQVVSASTDSTLRVWCVKTGRCLRVLRGHTNEKNFVGLSGFGDHIMCGSENSRVFFYYKSISEPVCSYLVGKDNATEEDSEGFVSSVCWKKDSDYCLVANSQGRVQFLKLK